MDIKIDKKYEVIKSGLKMYDKNGICLGEGCNLKEGEIATLKIDCVHKNCFMFVRDNGDMSIKISENNLCEFIKKESEE